MPKKQNYKDDPTTPKVLKVRCGNPKGGGKGALANENQAFTLSVTNDQIVFQPKQQTKHEENKAVCYGMCAMSSSSMKSPNPNSGFYEAKVARSIDTSVSNPTCAQGGIVVCEPTAVDVYNFSLTGDVCRTIATPSGGLEEHIPCVIEAYGFDTYNQEITKEKSHTLRTPGGGDSTAKIIMTEYHPNDSRLKIDESGTCQTLTGRMGTGGNNVPVLLVVNDQGGGVIQTTQKEISPTLRAEMHQHPPIVVAGESNVQSEAYGVPLNFRPENTRVYKEVATTICNGTNPGQHQGVIVFEPGSSSRVGGHIYHDGKTGALRAKPGDNQQCVVMVNDPKEKNI